MADLEKQVPINTKPIKINDPLPPKRRRNCCRSCLSVLLKIIITVIILAGLPIALFFIIVNPQKMKVTITEATLNQFSLTNNTNFKYNLDLNLAIRNPNRIMGFHYESFNSWLYYGNPMEINYEWSKGNFNQGKKNTTVRELSFKGNQTLALGFYDAVISKFNREKSGEVFSFDVKMEFWVKVKLGKIKIGTFIPRIDCELKVPLSDGRRNATTTTSTFKATKCDVVFRATSIFDRGFENCKSCN
ncbi:hypothetical protein UlMin_005429 [Ulmus minor]